MVASKNKGLQSNDKTATVMHVPELHTLDHNCIIDLETHTGSQEALRSLLEDHSREIIRLRVTAVGASERGATQKGNISEFLERLARIGLGGVEVLKPIGRFGITYFDWCLLSGDEMVEVEKHIHQILFPTMEFDYSIYCAQHGIDVNSGAIDPRWLNAKCDVLSFWCNLHYGNGIYVTSDRNFHKHTKKPRLIALGARGIVRPIDYQSTISH